MHFSLKQQIFCHIFRSCKYKIKAQADSLSEEASTFLACHIAEERESESDTKGHRDTEGESSKAFL